MNSARQKEPSVRPSYAERTPEGPLQIWKATEPDRASASPAGGPVQESSNKLTPSTWTISPGAYLRSMAAIAWNSIRHPFSTTIVDLTTGEATNLLDHS